MIRSRRQLNLFRDVGGPVGPRQTLADLDAMAVEAAEQSHHFFQIGEGAERRAVDHAFSALMLFGAVAIIEEREARHQANVRAARERQGKPRRSRQNSP